MPSILRAAIACAFFLIYTGAHASTFDTMIIFKATNLPTYHPGDGLDLATPLTLAGNQQLVGILDNGSVVTINGPFNASPTSEFKSLGDHQITVTDQVDPLLRTTDQFCPGDRLCDLVTLPMDYDPWLIDTSKSYDICVHEAVAYDIGRPNGGSSAIFKLMPIASPTKGISIGMEAGRKRVGIPDGFSFKDGVQYRIVGPTSDATITAHIIPEQIPTDKKITIAWFLLDHCDVQAHALAGQILR